eukprot:1521380-Heterocapsa_arctica.AAC.1
MDLRHDNEVECCIDVVDYTKNVKLFECCCAPDSLLAAWFLAHGQGAERLTLPDNDMSFMGAARRLLAALRGRAIDGRRSLVW